MGAGPWPRNRAERPVIYNLDVSLLVVLLVAATLPVLAASPAPQASVTTASDTSPALAAAQALVARVSPRVEALRGLKFKRPVTVKLADAKTARAHFSTRVERFSTPERAHVDETVFRHLGLLPPGTTLASGLMDVLEDQARGYYDPGSDTFYLIDGHPDTTAEAVVAHELTHALDDQHYAIDSLLENAADDDAESALGAVIEGSGTLVMAAYLADELRAGRLRPGALQEMQTAESSSVRRLQAAAPLFQRSLTAPYVLGLGFLLRGDATRLTRGVPTADIDRAFADPPRSSEQILHPEKYWDPTARDLPVDMPLPNLAASLGPNWRLAGTGRVGELLLGVLVGAPTPEAAAGADAARWIAPAAAGLAGDAWQHYVNGERSVTLLAALWDTERDAREFVGALRRVPERRAYRYGRAVLLVAGDGQASADTLAPVALGALATLAAEARGVQR